MSISHKRAQLESFPAADSVARPARLRALSVASIGRLPAALGCLCLTLSLLQRPGLTVTDTRIDLSVAPSLFLSRTTQVFSGTGDLGHVQSGQFAGYLFPMGPWYALLHAAGIPTWIAQRLWLAALLFAAAYGTVRLMDALVGAPRRTTHGVAAVLYAINPFVVVYVSRATVNLLALAVLPWLMLAVARGVRDPRGWRWPAVIGVLAALSGGGVNAAQVAWIALAPIALLMWEATVGRAGAAAALRFAVRAAVCAVVGSAWWLVPVFVQGAFGGDFLSFTEQPQSIWETTSMSESLRLLGYWPMYLGTGYGAIAPVMRIGRTYLFDVVVVVGSFLIPAAALLGLRETRRWAYAPFFGLLACAGLVAMCSGFPHGTAFSHTLEALYRNVPALRFLRTTYKAAPVVALSLAVLGGGAAGALVERSRRRRLKVPGVLATRILRVAPDGRARSWLETVVRHRSMAGLGTVTFGAAAVVWALPLFTGHAIDRRLAYGHVPTAWSSAVADAAHAAGENGRTMILPGELFGDYRWGRTWDSVAPALSRRPIVIRQAVRYGDQRAAQLLDTVDDQVQQARLVAGELPSMLALLGVRQVLVPTDALNSQSGGLDPAGVAAALRGQPGFATPLAAYGPRARFEPGPGRDGPAVALPELRRYGVAGAAGLVRLDASGPATIVDGGPGAIPELAADGRLTPGRPLFYAADLSPRQLSRLVAAGARLVFSDSNRRGLVAATYVRQDVGPTLTATAPLPASGASWDPFPGAGVTAQTVAHYTNGVDLVAPQPPGAQLFPAFRPLAALDGDPSTAWLPDPSLPSSDRWMELRLPAPRPISTITIVPKPVDGISPLWVAISVNGGPEREELLAPGPNPVVIDSDVRTLRWRLSRVAASALLLGAGGLEDVAIPGVTPIQESLLLPRLLARETAAVNLSHAEVAIALTRSTGDFPTRTGNDAGVPLARSEIAATDPESALSRVVTLPAPRRFSLSGWATVSPTGFDQEIDALTGSLRGWSVSSQSRFEGVPRDRASSAVDGDPSTAWVGDLVPAFGYQFGRDASILPLAAAGELLGSLPGLAPKRWTGALQAPLPWWAVRGPRRVRVQSLRLLPGPARYAFPSRVRVVTDAGAGAPLRVAADGTVTLRRPVRTRSLLIEILAVRPPSGSRLLRAVAIGEVRSPFRPPPPRRTGTFRSPCGGWALVAGRNIVSLQASGTVAQLDAGAPVRIAACGPSRAFSLPAGTSTILAPAGLAFRVDHLFLDSPPRTRVPVAAVGSATVAGPLTPTGVAQDALVRTATPGWLVLAESYSPGWTAVCRNAAGRERSLGAPLPIDGFANGWRVNGECRRASFVFAPQRAANAGFLVSLIGLPLLLGLALLGRRRRRPTLPAPELWRPIGVPFVKLGWLAALTVGTVSTIVIGFFFALPIGPFSVLLVRRGTTSRRLFGAGGLLLLAVPVVYVLRAAPNAGGYDFTYAYDNLVGHWLAVAGVCLIAGGCLLELLAVLRPGRPPALSPDAAAPARERPPTAALALTDASP